MLDPTHFELGDYCANVVPPCLKGLTIMGIGVDVTVVDPWLPFANSFKERAVQVSMTGSEVVLSGVTYQTASGVECSQLNEASASRSFSSHSTDKEFSQSLATDMQVSGRKGSMAAGGSSAYANEFRTNLEASVTTVLMTSVVAKGNFRFSGEEMMSHYLENFLQTQTPERIEKFFVSEFGTHYIVSGSVGGRVQSKATMSDCVQRQFVKQDIEAAADFEVQKCEIKTKAPAERFWRLKILQKAPAERF